ncbi:competence protein CoiA [Limosilactobacillus agrestis]|uniref:Competence protein CoiA n=1 Tax=Limosilactobacillus agrestis TaxID=2759748 RepID=A0A7W3YMC5_9LACO|nr:competence protein CoiA family protein [Limosilactobacillus agrestis]MBB1096316.1 competence protein CoiA [Limosilactobacillus agrestis]MCD7112172.1 competence protein CoiA [Limosilactobacillus agrestis]MCD7119473.1 competence protein CoiA [Limosilactobacillus agrestis]MCD7130268.1 competence protein CoiA [Limosilactobacillus agrestis]
MLIAVHNDQLVLAENAKSELEYYCPGCRKGVILRQGTHKITHYAHKKRNECGFSEGETLEHLKGKKQIYQWAQKHHWNPQLEVYFPTIAQRPDILLKINGQTVAIEFQCSPLSLERLLARNEGYRQLKIPVWWILGSPYLHNLRNKKIVQFTQIVKKQFVLLFWDVKKAQLVINQKYRRCSYSRLKYDKKTILMKQIEMLKKKQYHFPSKEIKELSLTTFKHTGHALSECPLVCHDLIASWPAMAIPVIIWRIGVILELTKYPLFYFWKKKEWENLLMKVNESDWLIPGCLSPEMIRNNVIDQYTSELIDYKIILKKGNQFVLVHRPQWFNDSQLKLQLINDKRRS